MACSLAHSPYLPPVDAVQRFSGDKKMTVLLSSGVYDGLFHKVEGLLDPSTQYYCGDCNGGKNHSSLSTSIVCE